MTQQKEWLFAKIIMMAKTRKHLLVTGCPRSGTTFLGSALSIPINVGYVREPFNSQFGLRDINEAFPYLFDEMPNQQDYDRTISQLLGNGAKFRKFSDPKDSTLKRLMRNTIKSGSHYTYLRSRFNPLVDQVIIKDPLAALASDYLHRQYGMKVVVIIRDPLAVISSMDRVGIIYDLEDLKRQENLYQHHLKNILGPHDHNKLPAVEQRALLWKSINYVLLQFIKANPNFIVVHHHQISADPLGTLPKLYQLLGLNYTPKVAKKITDLTSSKNPGKLNHNQMHVLRRNSKQLAKDYSDKFSKADLGRIKSITDDLYRELLGVDSLSQPKLA